MHPFPYKIYFVNSAIDTWRDVTEDPGSFSRDDVAERLRVGRDIWIISIFLELHRSGWDVELVGDFVAGQICVCHYDDVSSSNSNVADSYVVAVRADRDRTFICEQEVIQSPAQADWAKCHYIPHWPQPNLTVRDPLRGSNISTVAYFGASKNLAAEFRAEKFREQLSSLGLTLLMKGDDWTDYSDVDVVLAVRDGRQQFLDGKPASKLFNAWIAGCAAVLGNEAAYRHHGEPGRDYFEADDSNGVIECVRRLVEDPHLYERMVEEGKSNAARVDGEALTAEWHSFFQDKVRDDYRTWMHERQQIGGRVRASARFRLRALRRTLRGRRYVRGYTFEGETSYRPHFLRRMWWRIEDLILD